MASDAKASRNEPHVETTRAWDRSGFENSTATPIKLLVSAGVDLRPASVTLGLSRTTATFRVLLPAPPFPGSSSESISESDEPCNALDPIAGGVVEDLILSLKVRYTVILVTHQPAQARRIADHTAVFWMKDGAGNLIEHGPAARILGDPSHPDAIAHLRGLRG